MSSSVTHARIAIRIPQWLGYGREIYQGIGNYMAENGLLWQVDSSLEADGELRPMTIDESWRGDGAIFFRYSKEEAAAFAKKNAPLISVSRVSNCPWVPRVHSNNHMIGKLAAMHFIGTGSQNLVCWIDPARPYSIERLEGFQQCASNYNREVIPIETPASNYPVSSKWKDIDTSIQNTLKSLTTPSAIFARDDIFATAILRNAYMLDIKTPEDLIVLGVGDDPILSSVTIPTLSSISIPAKKIGWHAAKMLHQRLLENQPIDTSVKGEVIELPVSEVIQRKSTDQLQISDTLIADACQMIRMTPIQQKITVKHICQSLDVSTTTLLQRFQNNVGMSPKQYIDRTRYEEAIRMLNQTNWPIKKIAYALGFRSPEEFDRFFKRHADSTPGQFRKE